MLWGIAIVLILLWAIGLVASITMGGFIHMLVVAAFVLLLVRIIQGRRRPMGPESPGKGTWPSVSFKP